MNNYTPASPRESEERETFIAAKERSDAVWADLDLNAAKYRVLTGDRPTGALHIGHYFELSQIELASSVLA